MLKGIPSIISPELLKIMMEMGHGDELVIGDKNAHQGTRRADNRIVRKPEQAHEKAEQRRENSAEEIHRNKMPRTHPLCDFRTEHPEHEHVEEEMHEIDMDEHVRHVTPKFERNPRHKSTVIVHVISHAPVTGTEIDFNSSSEECDYKNKGIR